MIVAAELYRADLTGRRRWKRVPSGKEVGARLSSLCTDVALRMEDDGGVHIAVYRQDKSLLSWDCEPDPPEAADKALKQRATRKAAIKNIADSLGMARELP